MKLLTTALLVASAFVMTVPAHAQFAKPEDAIKYRQSSMFIMGQNMGRIGAMAQGKVPFDAKVAADSAATVEFMAKLPWAAFMVEGSDKGAPTKSNIADIMKDKQKFADFADKLQAETAKMSAAAKTGSLDNIKASLGGVGSTCKGCHDAFQNK